MKKPNSTVITIYWIWCLIHISLMTLAPKCGLSLETWRIVYPFTKDHLTESYLFINNWDIRAYDLTELAYCIIAPILIYYVITLSNKKPNV